MPFVAEDAETIRAATKSSCCDRRGNRRNGMVSIERGAETSSGVDPLPPVPDVLVPRKRLEISRLLRTSPPDANLNRSSNERDQMA